MRKILTLTLAVFLLSGLFRLAPAAEAAKLDRGYVSFTVDDNDSSVYSLMYPVLKKYSFPATAYVVTDWMNTKGHLKWSELKTLQNAGKWEIGNHTKSHKDLTQLSAKNMKNEINKAQSAFTKNKIIKPKTFAAPYGEFNEQVISILRSLGFTSNRWAWSEFGKFNEPDSFDPFNITVVSLRSPLAFDDAKKLIDEAVSEKKWLVFVLHGLVPGPAGDYEFSVNDFQKTADYLNSLRGRGEVDVKTVSQGVRLMKQSDSSPSDVNSSQSLSSSQSSSQSTSSSQLSSSSQSANISK